MATLFTLFGSCEIGLSANALSAQMSKATGGRRRQLDWYGTGQLVWRCVDGAGKLAGEVSSRLRVYTDLACLARMEKDAEFHHVWTDLAIMFDQFSETAAIIRSDGTVLAVRHGHVTWLSDLSHRLSDPAEWIAFAAARYAVPSENIVHQNEIQNTLL
ncbi:hypothetical protein [Jannaschia aquimarina]|uniref:Uncharacterized protein n=1 Tax=Jannaschia aquimarina TaxID=935700 RepID=A0A0D1ECW6_9RHOB|nr:hypothetical protein [Jannaschia aquimarina]KIT15574.1 hypothetical protein jaqu_26710 [Jannaschia aquimarina]SNT27147.1 hypothetical protein SAMN05421775_109125 [Jannaschia aquimarina]